LRLLPFGKYKIAYLHLFVKRKYKRKSKFFANRAAIQYKGLKNVTAFRSGRNPGSAHAADQPGKGKAADPVGRSAALSKSQTLAGKSQSRSGESRESRGIVAKSFGIVVKVVKVAQSSES
jgi:hypothetical protein